MNRDNAKIMLVDDSAYMRGILKKILRGEGYDDFVEAADGNDAVRKYGEERPDLVLLDIIMPHKNGVDALREIREMDRDARVVMVSAIGQDVVMEEAKAAGAEDFIVKPFRPEQVKDALRKAFRTD